MAASSPPPSSWRDLPPELLGLVLLRLPSHVDRARLRAVCHPWRSSTSLQPLPLPLPWLALRDGSLVDPDSTTSVHSMPIPHGTMAYLAFDNLAFLVHDDGGCSLLNPLSRSTIPLPELAAAVRREIDQSEVYCSSSYIRKAYVKAKLSSPLDSSPDPIIAAMILEGFQVAISTCKLQCAISPFQAATWKPGKHERIADIAFLHGKLYTLTEKEGLHVLGHAAGCLGKPGVSDSQCITDDPKNQQIYHHGTDHEYLVLRYLVESDGRLLMVRRWMSVPPNGRLGDMDRTRRFELFQADLTVVPGRWMKVDSLSGQALFLSSECSKSVLASQHGGAREDCIYFMHRVFDNPSAEYFGLCVDPLGDSGVYNMKDGKITPFLPETVMAQLRQKHQFMTWFFPDDV